MSVTRSYLPGQMVVLTGSTDYYSPGTVAEIVALPDDGWDYHVRLLNGSSIIGVNEDGFTLSGFYAGGTINWKPGDPVPGIV